MFCTNCGKKIQDDIKFCPYCGAPVLPPVPAKEEPPVEEIVEEAPAVEEVAEETIEEIAAEGPAIEEAVSEEPMVPEPAAEEILEDAAVIEETAAEAPAIEEISDEGPVIEEAVAEEPIVPEPAAEGIAEDATVIEEAAAEAPAVEDPVAGIPAVAETAAEEVAAAAAGQAEAAEPAAAAEEAAVAEPAETVPAEEPPKKKKTGLIAAIVAVIVIAAGVGGYFIYQNLPSTKLAKLRTQIAATIESNDYQGTLDLIEQAYEYAPDDEELRSQYVACSQAILLNKFTQEQYEDFIAEADKLIKDYPESAETLEPMIKESYGILADKAIDTHDIPTMQAIKDRLTDLTGSGRFNFSEKITWIEDNIQHVEMTNLFQTLADKLLPLIKSGDRAAVFDTVRSEFISSTGSARKLAPNRATVEYHFPLYSKADENGKRLGIYYSNSHYCFYYGNYNDTRREGDAIWFCADNLKTDNAYRDYWTEGSWSNDKPNGTFTISNLSKYANSDKEQLVEGSVEVTDGLYNGKGVFTYDGSAPLSGSYRNGIADVIMTTDPNGNPANVILISEDGKTWVSRSNINDPLGIYGFY